MPDISDCIDDCMDDREGNEMATGEGIEKSVQIIKSLQNTTGLFSAAGCYKTGYNRAWIRDNVYTALGLEAAKQTKEVVGIYRALLDIFLKHEYKIEHAIAKKPQYGFQYIHPRYDALTGEELWEEWGNKQNDAIGAFLFKVGDLESRGIKVTRGKGDLRVLQKLVLYLKGIEYWHDADNGMWEENEEVHASSIGACVAGLKSISKVIGIDVPKWLIENGENALNELLPHESKTKSVDLALLSLIYPYNVANERQRDRILKNVETYLLRERGVIRYIGDKYYSNGKEAEWTMGLPWLAKIYKQMNRPNKYAFYMRKTVEAMNENRELPELYFAESGQHNENSPLAWAQALYVVAQTG